MLIITIVFIAVTGRLGLILSVIPRIRVNSLNCESHDSHLINSPLVLALAPKLVSTAPSLRSESALGAHPPPYQACLSTWALCVAAAAARTV